MIGYPETKKVSHIDLYHGKKVEDQYVWLENAKDQEVLDWVERQNRFTDEFFFKEKQYDVEKLISEMKQKPAASNYYNIVEHFGKIYATKRDENGKGSIVILNEEFKEQKTILNEASFNNEMQILRFTPSPKDNGIAIVTTLIHGAARPTTLVFDFLQNIIIKQLDNIFSATFSQSGYKVYFSDAEVIKSENYNINRVKVYDIKNDETKTIFEYKKNSPFFTLTPSQCGNYIGLHVMKNYIDAELIIIDTSNDKITKLTDDINGAFKYMGTVEDKHYVMTNVGAEFGKIIVFPVLNPSYEKAVEIIPQSKRMIQDALIVCDKIIVSYMEDVVSVISVYDKEGDYLYDVELPSKMGSVGGIDGFNTMGINESPNLYIPFESFTNSPTIIQYNVKANKCKMVIKEKDINIPSDIVVTQKFINARDGVKIPAFIVHKKNVVLDGNNPTLMFGYGGYNISMPPVFQNKYIGIDIWEWVDKGYVYVNCNIRGGNEYGTSWHRQGSLENKKNAFNDFIDITEWLIENKWTKPEKIAIVGGSNGGLLMTALITMRPDLWGAVIASVPHTDMLRFKNDDRGPMYITEYGNPMDEEIFEYMLSYSPYHNIKSIEYPAIYIQTGEQDNNVPPYHAKKFAAKMQELNKSENPVLLRVLAKGSHDRGKGYVLYKTTAEMQIFVAKALKL